MVFLATVGIAIGLAVLVTLFWVGMATISRSERSRLHDKDYWRDFLIELAAPMWAMVIGVGIMVGILFQIAS